jgi:hypothetical protein
MTRGVLMKYTSYLHLIALSCCFLLASCARKWERNEEVTSDLAQHPSTQTPLQATPLATLPKKKKTNIKTQLKTERKTTLLASNIKSLDFDVQNKTGKTIYASCFAYIKKRDFGRWRWDKSPVYKLDHLQTQKVHIDYIDDDYSRKHVFGYLGVFTNEKDADDAIYELLPDRNKLDLDQLMYLHDKKVTLEIERYGFKGEYFEFDFAEKNAHDQERKINRTPELDFFVENKTGKPILATCFVYQKKAKGTWFAAIDEKDDMEVWRYDKTPVISIPPNEVSIIDVDTITESRDRSYVRGFLAIFDEDESKLAQESTFELLGSHRKLNLGLLSMLKNKKVVVDVERYGIAEDFIDFVIKPIQRVDFTKINAK